jgi:hypothetical protein
MTAPAAAPMAASRCVCLTTVPLLVVVVVVVVPADELVRVVPPLDLARCTVVPEPEVEALAPAERSAAFRLSSVLRCCAASDKSRFRVVSAAPLPFRLHAEIATIATSANAVMFRIISASCLSQRCTHL